MLKLWHLEKYLIYNFFLEIIIDAIFIGTDAKIQLLLLKRFAYSSILSLISSQGGQQPGKPGKVREFETYLENLEKSGNFIVGQGKWIMSQIYVYLVCR